MLNDLWNQILQGAANSTPLEGIAALFGLMSVWFAKKEHILVFPTGIISTVIYIYICGDARLYADMGINGYYTVMSIYGWYVWSRLDEEKHHIPITRLSRVGVMTFGGIAIASFLLLYFSLDTYTDADMAFWDSMTTALFIVAMILMARKKIEHWIAWILGDLISIPLYLYKGLAFTSAQYLIFTGIAIAGLISWQRSLKKSGE